MSFARTLVLLPVLALLALAAPMPPEAKKAPAEPALYEIRLADGSQVKMKLLLSARSLDDVLYRDELDADRDRVEVDITLTRGPVPDGWTGFTRRIDREMIAAVAPAPEAGPRFYICGPTPFVESAANLLVGLGHDPARVYTERFGPTGG